MFAKHAQLGPILEQLSFRIGHDLGIARAESQSAQHQLPAGKRLDGQQMLFQVRAVLHGRSNRRQRRFQVNTPLLDFDQLFIEPHGPLHDGMDKLGSLLHTEVAEPVLYLPAGAAPC